MGYLSNTDIFILEASAVGLVLACAKSQIIKWTRSAVKPAEFPLLAKKNSEKQKALAPTRKIKKQLEQTKKSCVIFYGSQTGTAEKLALRLAKDASTRYNLQCLVADLDDYDYDDLSTLHDGLAVFILATYGEGEPTDNAIPFSKFLSFMESGSKHSSLMQLRYAAFGLGSSFYQHFNYMIRRTDIVLRSCGADRIGELGIGDDGKGTLENDFDEWRKHTLADIAEHFRLPEIEYAFKPIFQITESKAAPPRDVFLGEPNKAHLRNKRNGPFTAQNPLRAQVVEAKELCNSSERSCLHVEFDIGDSTLTYDTGDHLAVWPVNADSEVEQFLKVFGLWEVRATVIELESLDPTVKVPIPTPTTYEAAARHYLDIGGPISRQVLEIIASVVQDAAVQSELIRLSSDSEPFQRSVTARRLTLARLLSTLGDKRHFGHVPFSLIIENVAKLKPRYYSISSSSLCPGRRVSITAMVDSIYSQVDDVDFKGINTNYLLALKNKFCASQQQPTSEQGLTLVMSTHQVDGPRGNFSHPTALIHVRRSKFRLPRQISTPVVMIGPGTGVAPFRAFVQERAIAAESGRKVGRTMLFCGCRRRNEDFLYRDEWDRYQLSFPAHTFSVNAAFSREESKKIYVQDLLSEHAAELKRLILKEKAHVYVCGDASRMAKDVFKTFAGLIDGQCGESGVEYLREMKASGRWSEDVW